MKKELFTVSFDNETKEFEMVINRDLIETFYTNVEDINGNIDFDLFNKFKNNLMEALRKGDKFEKLVEEGGSIYEN